MQIAKLAAIALALAVAGGAEAAISAQEAARLGAELTPLGVEKAGNAAGTQGRGHATDRMFGSAM